jgi:hypothetical protein
MLALPRRASCRIAVPIAFLALLVLAAPALAAAPAAQNDSLTASPTGVRDVLANDSDPDGNALSVSANSNPPHGSATCSSLGACLYTADGGFTGSDSFTYTARDTTGATSTATVSVDVVASSAKKPFQALDDDIATRAGQGLNFNVLANDTGSGLHVTSNGSPKHGTVTCSASGACRYTPTGSYTGTDGFLYTVGDDSQRTTTAAVHVLVAPAGAGYGISVNGSPVEPSGGAVPPGGQAQWGVGVNAVPAGITGEELRALALPSATAALSGPHALTGGSLKAAAGWASSVAGDGTLQVAAGKDALLGEGLTKTFPRPLPPISQGTGGDGHVPILVGSKVFAFYHHSFPTSATCVDRATGDLCPGYPKQLELGTTDINGPGVVVGSRIYTHLLPNSGYAQTAPISLFCWNAETDSTCGLTIVDRVARSSNPGASAPVLAGGKIWFGGDTGKLYCVDPATGNPCATPSIATGHASDSEIYWDVVTHGSRVFLAHRNGPVACVDVTAGARCAGWSTPKSFGSAWNVVNQHNASGAAIGVCAFLGAAGSCVTDANPAVSTPVTNWVTKDTYSQGYSHSLEAETGRRTLVGSLSEGGMGCYDWSTMAPCTGGGYEADGWLRRDGSGSFLPSAYGAAYDGSCAIGLGDPGRVFTVDPAGSSPCLSLGSGADSTKADLRDQRCDGTVGGATWQDVRLSDTDSKEMESVVVTVRDAATGEVLKSGDLIKGSSTLDLSGIDANAHPALTVDANAKSARGNAAWDDGIPPRITLHWHSDAQQACARTTGTAECGASPASIAVNGHLATPATADASAQLSLLRNACSTAQVLGNAQRSCAGLRRFTIRVRYKGTHIRKLVVTVRGKRQQIVRMRPRPIVRIDLRKRPRETTRVKITITTKAGKRLRGTRVYHPCRKRLPSRGFKY